MPYSPALISVVCCSFLADHTELSDGNVLHQPDGAGGSCHEVVRSRENEKKGWPDQGLSRRTRRNSSRHQHQNELRLSARRALDAALDAALDELRTNPNPNPNPTGAALLAELRKASKPLREALQVHETGCAALKSVPSSEDARQVLHCDFNPDAITRLREKVRKEALRMVVPWTLLVTFKPGAKMYFKVGGSMIIAVLKRPGDAVLFRGDVSHGGGCYKVEHWRFHFYWEPMDTIYKPLRGFPSYRHYVDEESGKTTLALFNVERHADQPGGSWSVTDGNPSGFVLWMGKSLSVDEATELANSGALLL